MRTIKFRGKSIETGEWCFGNLNIEYEGTCNIYWWENRLVDAECNAWEPIHCGGSVDPNTVGQFTGKSDKNEKEMYDGDIVEWKQAAGGVLVPDGTTYRCIIQWSEQFAGWECKHLTSESRFTFCGGHMTVVGSIHIEIVN